MTRVCIPFAEWPKPDQKAWLKAIEDGDILDGRGPANHWAAATRQTNIEHYGRWLGFLATRSPLTSCAPESRIKPEIVKEYVSHLNKRLKPCTVASSLIGLKEVAKAMAPDEEWRWLKDACNRLSRTAEPSKDKRTKMLSSGLIYRKALKHLDKLTKTDLTRRADLVGFRDTLMVALMTGQPLRLKNFAGLTIGRTFLRAGDGWLIKIPGEEVKNKVHLSFEVPERLLPYLKTYLERVRAPLVQPGETALWVAWDGRRIAPGSIYYAFIRTTQKIFGKDINPHLFRDIAATTLASKSLNAAMAAPGLLGHRNAGTTEKYYIHARQLEAGRTVTGILMSKLADGR